MCAAKVISSKKPKSNKLATDLKKLNPSESEKLIELAIQTYPSFVKEVSKAIKTAKSRIEWESTQKVYDDLVAELDGILEGPYYDSDDSEMEKLERWGLLEHDIDQIALSDVYERIGKTVDSSTANETYEVAFKTLLLCWKNVSATQKEKPEEDLSRSMDGVKSVAKDMALEWMRKDRKDGKINEDICKWVLALVSKDVRGVQGRDELMGELEEEFLEEQEQQKVKRIRVK
jgi:hypothetical protein